MNRTRGRVVKAARRAAFDTHQNFAVYRDSDGDHWFQLFPDQTEPERVKGMTLIQRSYRPPQSVW